MTIKRTKNNQVFAPRAPKKVFILRGIMYVPHRLQKVDASYRDIYVGPGNSTAEPLHYTEMQLRNSGAKEDEYLLFV
jgi:hypothetical protein